MNWGNKLLITFGVFATGMSYLVYRSVHTNYELVETDYYKSELKYQDVIDGNARANALPGSIAIHQRNDSLLVELPATGDVHGDTWFYCAYDERLDRHLNLGPGAVTAFKSGTVLPGHYTSKSHWIADGKEYYLEKEVEITR